MRLESEKTPCNAVTPRVLTYKSPSLADFSDTVAAVSLVSTELLYVEME